jgi:hypothetical protein
MPISSVTDQRCQSLKVSVPTLVACPEDTRVKGIWITRFRRDTRVTMPKISVDMAWPDPSSVTLQWPKQTWYHLFKQWLPQFIDIWAWSLSDLLSVDYVVHRFKKDLLPGITPFIIEKNVTLSRVHLESEFLAWR